MAERKLFEDEVVSGVDDKAILTRVKAARDAWFRGTDETIEFRVKGLLETRFSTAVRETAGIDSWNGRLREGTEIYKQVDAEARRITALVSKRFFEKLRAEWGEEQDVPERIVKETMAAYEHSYKKHLEAASVKLGEAHARHDAVAAFTKATGLKVRTVVVEGRSEPQFVVEDNVEDDKEGA